MAKMVLIRGLPGAGKSTYARKNYPGYLHFEADMFFENTNGTYVYDRDLIAAAHDWCYGNTAKALRYGFDVVVSNTFCAYWEIEKYLMLRYLVNAEIEIIELHTQYGSIHGVPDEAVDRMKERWYDLSQEFDVKVIK